MRAFEEGLVACSFTAAAAATAVVDDDADADDEGRGGSGGGAAKKDSSYKNIQEYSVIYVFSVVILSVSSPLLSVQPMFPNKLHQMAFWHNLYKVSCQEEYQANH